MIRVRSSEPGRSRLHREALLLGALLGLACGEPSEAPERPDVGGLHGIGAEPEALERTSVRAAYIAARQAEGLRNVAYHVERAGGAGSSLSSEQRLVAGNPKQRFTTTFSGRGVRLARTSEGWALGLRVSGVACAGRVTPVEARGEPSATETNRVEYERRAGGVQLREWYVNGPLGLEQGVTLPSAPCEDSGKLGVVVEVEGLTARRVAGPRDADTLEFVDGSGVVRLGYSDLSARDAKGRALAAHMSATGPNEVVLSVDARGASWPVIVDPLVFGQERKLTASDGGTGDRFGHSVALSGDTALVGARDDDFGLIANQGSAYVFVRSAGTWSEEQRLTASFGAANDNFGWSVALSGDTALVGAASGDIGSNANQGSAYVFVRSAGTWSEEQRLTASDGAAEDYFGTSLALSGDTALVGAYDDDVGSGRYQGSAYVFVRSAATWSEEQKLTASDGEADDRFGYSVALSGDTALVGAAHDDVGSNANQGSAYVFVRSAATWSEEQRLTASDGAAGDYFGASVALSDDTALVGAAYGDVGSNANQGSAYVFVRSAATWSEEQRLSASDGAADDRFAISLALSGDTAIVGARYDDVGSNEDQGSAYVFVRSGSTWSEQQKLTASDGLGWDEFGYSVALSGDTALVGAYYDDVNENLTQGSASVFVLASADGDPCSVDAECASFHCADSRCCDSACIGSCAACSVAAGADTDGACKIFPAGDPGSPACAPQTCTGGSPDCSDCVHDTDCPNETYCTAGNDCSPVKQQGDACTVAQGADCAEDSCRVCGTLPCVDGVCCDSACDDVCEACTRTLNGSGDDGECGPIEEGTDPEDECTDDGAASCEHNGLCDGQGDCGLYPEETACAPEPCSESESSACTTGVCEDDICCDRVCTASEACRADLKTSGGDGTCGPATRAELGRSCSGAEDCTSGHCTEGLCCDSSCDGDCESCLGARTGQADGTCAFILSGTDPDGECPDNAACPERPSCNGSGRCTCETLSDACAEDGVTLVTPDPDDDNVDCTPYACASGNCTEACDDGSHCAPGYRCSSERRCVEGAAPAVSGENSGCACRTGSTGRSPGLLALALVLLGCLRRRRRVRAVDPAPPARNAAP